MARGKNGVTSQAGLKVDRPHPYLRTTGWTGLIDSKAPLLRFRMDVPLVVPPSGKMQKTGYCPVSSIIFYLSAISSTCLFLLSFEPSLVMKMQPRAWHITPKKCTFLNALFAANAVLKWAIRINGSSHDVWFDTIVEVYLGRTYFSL